MKKAVFVGTIIAGLLSLWILEGVAATITVDDDLLDFPNADFIKIQDAVNVANPGDTIAVYPGTYTENVDVGKEALTIQSVSGADVTVVQAASLNDHVFEVTADYVNIIGFTVKGAIGGDHYYPAGIYLHGSYSDKIQYCGVSENIISNNLIGLYLLWAFNNNITDNVVNSNKGSGITLVVSCATKIIGNDIYDNGAGIGAGYKWNGRLETSHSNTITRNNIHSNTRAGIALSCSSSNEISENNVYSNGDGILLSTWSPPYGSGNNKLTGNHVYSNDGYGIYLRSSSCKLRNNTIENNKYNFSVNGVGYSGVWSCYWLMDYYIQDIDTSNTINGKPVYYLLDEKDLLIDSSWNIGYLGIVNSENIRIRNIEVKNNNEQGILIACTNNSRIENVVISDNLYGIRLEHSSNNVIIGSNISNNASRGIHLTNSSNNTIAGNIVDSIHLYSFCGVTADNTITENNTSYICLQEGGTKNNTIAKNNISSGNIGIRLYGSRGYPSNNSIYLNDFTNNTHNVDSRGTNIWNSPDLSFGSIGTHLDRHVPKSSNCGCWWTLLSRAILCK